MNQDHVMSYVACKHAYTIYKPCAVIILHCPLTPDNRCIVNGICMADTEKVQRTCPMFEQKEKETTND